MAGSRGLLLAAVLLAVSCPNVHPVFAVSLGELAAGATAGTGQEKGSVKGVTAGGQATDEEIQQGTAIAKANLRGSDGGNFLSKVQQKPGTGRPKPFNGKATEEQLAVASKRLSAMEEALTASGLYSDFLKFYKTSGLDALLTNLLPFFGFTILAPQTTAFSEMLPMDWALVNSQPRGLLQVIAFHVLFPPLTASELTAAPAGTEFSTADYPTRGIVVYKLNVTTAQFNGRPDDAAGAAIVDSTIFTDSGETPIIVHGVDKVMIPREFFHA